MKFLICFAALTVLYGCQAATLKDEPNVLQGLDNFDVDQIASAAEEQADDDLVRSKKSQKSYGAPAPAASYGAPAPLPAVSYSYPSPVPTVPCGKSLLFSCQPSVAPVPCAAPAPSYGKPTSGGYAGAYSEPVPAYAAPHFHHGYQGYYPQVHYAPY